MPLLGLFNYREFLFSMPESVDVFQVVKFFLLYKCWESKETLFELFLERNISQNSARVQNYSNCLSVFFEMTLKCFPSSKFEPRCFAKCLQNLLIEKSVERLWRFSKGWT